MITYLQKISFRFSPGIVLCIVVALLAYGAEIVEKIIFGQAWMENLVLAILIGAIVRSFWKLPGQYAEGIGFCAKILLELAVVLLGAGISIHAVIEAGWGLLIGITLIVFMVIILSYFLGRFFGLSSHLAMLVACGNSICGNSAIAAAAPVIKANGSDIAASIAFTAALGIVVILLLPMAAPLLGLSNRQYGVLAGMTVYAVPQVLAAAAPVSLVSVQIATLVKLIRVLLLGPVIFILAIIYGGTDRNKLRLNKMIPWFIIGFVILMLSRSANIIPDSALKPMAFIANVLTVLSMAALGLGVDIRALKKAGMRVVLTAIISLCILAFMSLSLIHIIHFQ